mmetsp:Transcript_25605/g.67081  ORF Transcript_25605/g.67081 Transcript_25605/m.67081 type:complete len:261 (-) Transcript_25605:170-952(-)
MMTVSSSSESIAAFASASLSPPNISYSSSSPPSDGDTSIVWVAAMDWAAAGRPNWLVHMKVTSIGCVGHFCTWVPGNAPRMPLATPSIIPMLPERSGIGCSAKTMSSTSKWRPWGCGERYATTARQSSPRGALSIWSSISPLVTPIAGSNTTARRIRPPSFRPSVPLSPISRVPDGRRARCGSSIDFHSRLAACTASSIECANVETDRSASRRAHSFERNLRCDGLSAASSPDTAFSMGLVQGVGSGKMGLFGPGSAGSH